MKKTILAFAALSAAVSSYGQSLIAGWDFQTTNVSVTLDNGFQADVAGSSTALLYANGTNGSTDFNSNAFMAQGIGVGNTNLSGTYQGNNGLQGGNSADNSVGTKSFAVRESTGSPTFSLAWDNSLFESTELSFDYDTQNAGDYGTDFSSVVPGLYINLFTVTAFDGNSNLGSLTLGANSESSPGTWTFSNDGVDASVLDGVADARLVFTLDDARTLPGNFYYDNITLGGTAVPEPSSFAVIFGAMALVFTVLRRRK